MPEGHTLHRLALDHAKLLVGQAVTVSSPQGRFQQGAEALDGAVVVSVEALGKHLLYDFGIGLLLHVHLGLFGRFRRFRQPAPNPKGAVRLRLETDRICLDLSGPTACELLEPESVGALEARLGPDLLSSRSRPARAWNVVHRSRRTLGALLLDQAVLSGVGNVYRAEGLFEAGLHPELRGVDVSERDFLRLWSVLRKQLQAGVRDRRIVTRPHPSPKTARRGERTWVYKQRTCQRCGDAIRVWVLANRTMYACETCQRR